MKVVHLNNADTSGGAARAAFRIHKSLIDRDTHSRMWVNFSKSGDWTVKGPKGKLRKGISHIRRHLVSPVLKTMKTDNKILHSPAIFPSSWSKRINKSDADIIHLHWVGAEMASIADLGNIKKPAVWTLHDMWGFCGAEHVSWDERWREGYTRSNRSRNEKGFDINRWTWQRKVKHWKEPFNIVAVSQWLADCAQNSFLMKDWPVTIIPNCLNTDVWMPVDKSLARNMLGLPINVPIIAFGTYGANSEYHKGFDLLVEALKSLKSRVKDIELAIFGQVAPKNPPELGFKVNFTGHLHDELSLRLLYSAIDMLVVPSRVEAFGQTATESMACKTPVVAFGATGLLDIVDHKLNGYLAKPFESEDLANGIEYILNAQNYNQICENARDKVVKEFDSSVVSKKYQDLYYKVLR
jgi:glycosyltransferase involved in cell wall biosynthesis